MMVLHNVFLIFFKKPLEMLFGNPSGLKATKAPIVSSLVGRNGGLGKYLAMRSQNLVSFSVQKWSFKICLYM